VEEEDIKIIHLSKYYEKHIGELKHTHRKEYGLS